MIINDYHQQRDSSVHDHHMMIVVVVNMIIFGSGQTDRVKVYYLNVSFCVVGRFGRECRAPNIRHFHHHVYQHHFSVIIIIIIILHDYQVINRHTDHQHYDCSD